MALSRTAWIAAGLGARLVMIAVLVITVKITIANQNNYSSRYYGNHVEGFFKLRSYSYMIASSVMGVAGSLLQIPVAVYLLFKSKRMMPSALILNISMYADVVITVVLATGVGAGFGATVDLLWYVKHATGWDQEGGVATQKLYIDYYGMAYLPLAFLLAGMVLSMAATVVSARLRARAPNDVPEV